MSGGDDLVQGVTQALLDYLATHPGAADSIEGIRRWWLPAQLAAVRSADVEAALQRLVRAGVLSRRELPDGRVLYKRGRS